MSFKRIEKLSDAQIGQLVALYQNEWWTRGRTLAGVRTMLASSDVIVAFVEQGNRKLAAFSRVITDYTYKALVLDVIVAPAHRGTGLGRMLMEGILGHPRLRRVRHLELYCLPELLPFYRQWGFTEELGELKLLRRAK